jgi:hypothetical protein
MLIFLPSGFGNIGVEKAEEILVFPEHSFEALS